MRYDHSVFQKIECVSLLFTFFLYYTYNDWGGGQVNWVGCHFEDGLALGANLGHCELNIWRDEHWRIRCRQRALFVS